MKNRLKFQYLFSTEHATHWIPSGLIEKNPQLKALQKTHQGYDLGVLEIANWLSRDLQATHIEGTISRLVIDLNRSVNHSQLFGPATQSLSLLDKKQIIRHYWEPYFQRLVKELKKGAKINEMRWLSVHSFTPTWNHRSRRVDIGILDDLTHPKQREFSLTLQAALRRQLPSFKIYLNEPYRGFTDAIVHPVNRQIRTTHAFGICLEINQRHLQTKSQQLAMAKALSGALREIST